MADDKDDFEDDSPTEVIDRSALKRHMQEQEDAEDEPEDEPEGDDEDAAEG